MPNQALITALARSFLGGEADVESVVARATFTLGHPWRWLKPLAHRYVATLTGGTCALQRDVVQFLVQDQAFQRACRRQRKRLRIAHWLTGPQRMQPGAAAEAWDVPAIESAGDLAEWLSLTPAELDWFADLKTLARRKAGPQLQHYHYRVLTKSSGSIRLIEAPKERLKALQRQILSRILEKIPPHPAVHGFVKARSIKTFIAPHLGQRVVIRQDLRDFFPSISAARIQACFRTIGYPESVANLLAGICTNAAPRAAWNEASHETNPLDLQNARILYGRPHLPQGAPTSPILANLCVYRADCRLSGLAAAAGAHYTRYADDLAFSGSADFEKAAEPFCLRAAAILLEEDFTVHHRKTRIMRQGVRQHLAGLVANQHMNVMRPDFDRLKATLTNCIRLGPESQNRDAHPSFRLHLQGRVAFVESINPARGQRLRNLFEQIEWPSH